MNTNKIKQYIALTALKKGLETRISQINKQLMRLGPECVDEFARAECNAFTLAAKDDGGVLFQDGCPRKIEPTIDPKPSVTEENKNAFFAWLRENGHGELIKENVHPTTLKSWVKNQRKANQPIPEMVEVFDYKTLKITKVRARSGAKRRGGTKDE